MLHSLFGRARLRFDVSRKAPGSFLLIILAALIFIPSMSAQKIEYRVLPPDTIAHMERQRAFVADLATRHGLGKVTGTKTDYDLIQTIVSKKLIGKDKAWELQALGIVFGDAMISEEPKLQWIEVTDAWGTDPVIVFGEYAYQVNALTMISKRVEDGEKEPFVHALARTVLRLAREEAPKAGKR